MNLNTSNFQSQKSMRPTGSISSMDNFFNESFYKQKLSSDPKEYTYTSLQYIKKYFKVTRIPELINKTIRQTLESNYLPQNPYNMIGRILLHESIFQNIKVYYVVNFNEMKQRGLITREYKQMKIQNQNKISNIEHCMVQLHIDNPNNGFRGVNSQKNNNTSSFMIGWRLKPFIRTDLVKALWSELVQTKTNHAETLKQKGKKSKIFAIQNSLGGSILLRVGCPYSSEHFAVLYQFVYMNYSQSLDHYKTFADYIIDDCIRMCETSNNIFIKLSLHKYQPISIEWSADNLIHNRLKIVKEIEKAVMAEKVQFRVQCAAKVDPKNLKTLSVQFIRYHKVYILVEQESSKHIKINALNPITILLTAVHPVTSQYYSAITRSMPSSITELTHLLQQQLHGEMVYSLSNQEPSWVSWAIFYINLYDNMQNQKNGSQLKSSIVYMIDTPLYFVEELRYRLNITKLLSSRSTISHNQNQIYQILQRCEQMIIVQIRKQEHVYPQAIVFFEVFRRSIEVILQTKKRNYVNIKPQIQRLESMMKYLMSSFYQISFVLKGYLLSEIIRIDNIFGKQGTGQTINKTITYDIFLRKYKNMAERNLNIVKQAKELKKQIRRSDNDLRELILAKYVKNYGLYQIIYHYYWDIICGKKLNYPLTKFVNMLRDQALHFESFIKRSNKQQLEIQQSKFDGIMIYQKAADAKTEHLFYAFNAEALDDSKVKDYRVIKQVFEDIFESDILSQQIVKGSSLANMQKNSYIISIDSSIRQGQHEQANFNKCRIYADVVYHLPVPQASIYRIIYEQIKQKMMELDKKGFGIVGVFCGENQILNEDHVYPWTEHDQKFDVNFLRYQNKKELPYDATVKLIMNCKKNKKDLVMKAVFWLNGLLKVCTISFNFLINKQWMTNQSGTYNCRVFQKHQQITRWGNYNGLKNYLQTQKQIINNPDYDKQASLKQMYLQNHIDMIQFISNDNNNNFDIQKVRAYSPFYGKLEQAQNITQSLYYMLQYLKTDRENRFKIVDYKDTIQILEYYLFQKCLKEDRYIYSQGLSVVAINLITRIHLYIDQHQDNNGDQKQLIFLQKLTIKLMNCINHCLISCAFGVLEAIKADYLRLQDQKE